MPVDDYMKSIGYPTGGKAVSAPETKAGPSGPQGILAPGPLEGVQRGIAKGAAEFGVGTARLAGKGLGLISPGAQSKLGQLAEQVPGVTRLERFADRPYADSGELAGSLGVGALGGAATEKAIASGVTGLVDRFTPLARLTKQTAKGLGPYARGTSRFIPTTAGKVTKYTAPVAGAVGAGTAGGIAGNPQDPVTGAEMGAATSFVPAGVGRAVRSRAGQYLGGSLARGAAGAAAGGGLGYLFGGEEGARRGAMEGGIGAGIGGLGRGLAHGIRHSIVSYHSPWGQWLQRFGKGVFDKGGKLIGWINPLTGGFVASAAWASGAPQQAYESYTAPAAPVDEGDMQ